MKVRDHPYLNYKGLPSWPPVWSWVSGPLIKHPRGEVGILTKVERSVIPSHEKCFLHIDYDGGHYMGCLYIAQATVFNQILAILESHVGTEIKVIGDLELSDYSFRS